MVQKVMSQKKTKQRTEQNQNKNNVMKKTSRGRQKIEIKRIENDSHRQVASSKRRKGLFKKAAEICILTGAEVAIIARTESGNISAFGHPSIDGVIQRYLHGLQSAPAPKPTPINAELVDEDQRLSSELEAEKKKLKALKNANAVNNFWWDEPMDDLGLEELEQRLASLIQLRTNVIAAIDELQSQSSGVTDSKSHEMAAFNDQHCSQFMGVADNGEMKQTANSDGSDMLECYQFMGVADNGEMKQTSSTDGSDMLQWNQFMGVGDNGEMKQTDNTNELDMSECYQSLGNIDLGNTTKVDELGLSDYFQFLSNVDLEQTTSTDELFEGSQTLGGLDNVNFAALTGVDSGDTLESEAGFDFCFSQEDCHSFCLDPFGSQMDFHSLPS